jgi:hypothetical protein
MHVCDGGAAKRARAAAERPAAFRPRALSVAARFSFTGRAETWTVPRGGLFRITVRGAKAADGAHRRGARHRPPPACDRAAPPADLHAWFARLQPHGVQAARVTRAACRCASGRLHAHVHVLLDSSHVRVAHASTCAILQDVGVARHKTRRRRRAGAAGGGP